MYTHNLVVVDILNVRVIDLVWLLDLLLLQ